MAKELEAYLSLESAVLILDDLEHGLGREVDLIRDVMDAVWLRLSADEQERINARTQIDERL